MDSREVDGGEHRRAAILGAGSVSVGEMIKIQNFSS